MTTVETGTAIGVEYVEDETRATAIHEAGHAAASHVYMKDAESTRLSIRMRGGSLGHHKAREREERFAHFRSEVFARLVWTLGAMRGRGDLLRREHDRRRRRHAVATARRRLMVGVWAMRPAADRPRRPLRHAGRGGRRAREDPEALRRARRGAAQPRRRQRQPDDGRRPDQRRALRTTNKRKVCAQIIGQAYFTAYCFIAQNRAARREHRRDAIERKELHGDEVVELLSEAGLKPADMQYEEERTWPRP